LKKKETLLAIKRVFVLNFNTGKILFILNKTV